MRANWLRMAVLCAWAALATSCLAKRGGGGGPGDGGSSSDGAGGQAGEGAGMAGAGGSGSGQTTCGICIDQQVAVAGACEITAEQCEFEPTCLGWWDCLVGCAADDWSESCVTACDAGFPAAAPVVHSLVTCICATCSLDPDCTPLCP